MLALRRMFSTLGGSPVALRRGDVHVWCLFPDEVRDPSLLSAYEEVLLSGEERRGLDSAASPDVRKERLLARALVRATLAQYLGSGGGAGGGVIGPQDLVFALNEHGKPRLEGPGARAGAGSSGGIKFNLTHTPSLIMCAVTAGREVGIDVEERSRTARNPLRLARRRFAPAEVAALETAADPGARHELFVSTWTLKEAYVKATGQGISAPPGLAGFSVLLGPSPAAAEKAAQRTGLPAAGVAQRIEVRAAEGDGAGGTGDRTGPGGGYEYLLFRPSSQHTAALCVEKGEAAAEGGRSGDGGSRGRGEGGSGGSQEPTRVCMWRTVPLQWQEPLAGEGVGVVACSFD